MHNNVQHNFACSKEQTITSPIWLFIIITIYVQNQWNLSESLSFRWTLRSKKTTENISVFIILLCTLFNLVQFYQNKPKNRCLSSVIFSNILKSFFSFLLIGIVFESIITNTSCEQLEMVIVLPRHSFIFIIGDMHQVYLVQHYS